MAQYQTSADIITRALKKGGEPTNGNSSYSASLTEYLSDVQRKLVAGATVFELGADEVWPWSRSPHAVTLNILPAYSTGTLTVVNGTNTVTFSSAPSYSVQDWFIRGTVTGETYKIAFHTAAATTAYLETNFLGTSSTSYTFEAFRLDYDILPSYIYVTALNNTLKISTNGTTILSSSITAGIYTPTALATAWGIALSATAGVAVTVTYSTTTRLFTITSAGTTFQLLGERGSNPSSGMPLVGFDNSDYTGALTYTGTYPFGAMIRIADPIKYISTSSSNVECLIEGTDPISYTQIYSPKDAAAGTPTAFTKILEDNTGKITIRLNNYPTAAARIEVITVPYPVDLQNNANSVPVIPPKYYNILEYAGVYFLFLEKEDSKADQYLALAKAEIQAMQKHYRGEQFRTSGLFGYIAPRAGNLGSWNSQLRYGYDKDKW